MKVSLFIFLISIFSILPIIAISKLNLFLLYIKFDSKFFSSSLEKSKVSNKNEGYILSETEIISSFEKRNPEEK